MNLISRTFAINHKLNFPEKHEGIASIEKNVHRSSIVGKDLVKNHTSQSDLPKGHVPTRTTSFKENVDDVIVTYTPPSVAVKPTIIRPASSELPEEEISFSEKKVSLKKYYFGRFSNLF